VAATAPGARQAQCPCAGAEVVKCAEDTDAGEQRDRPTTMRRRTATTLGAVRGLRCRSSTPQTGGEGPAPGLPAQRTSTIGTSSSALMRAARSPNCARFTVSAAETIHQGQHQARPARPQVRRRRRATARNRTGEFLQRGFQQSHGVVGQNCSNAPRISPTSVVPSGT